MYSLHLSHFLGSLSISFPLDQPIINHTIVLNLEYQMVSQPFLCHDIRLALGLDLHAYTVSCRQSELLQVVIQIHL